MTTATDFYVTVHVHPHGSVQVFRWDVLCAQEELWLSSDLVLHQIDEMSVEHLRDARAWLVEHADRVAETARAFWSAEDAELFGVPEAHDVLNSPLAEALRDEAFFRAARDFAVAFSEDPDRAGDLLEALLGEDEAPEPELSDDDIAEFIRVLSEQLFGEPPPQWDHGGGF